MTSDLLVPSCFSFPLVHATSLSLFPRIGHEDTHILLATWQILEIYPAVFSMDTAFTTVRPSEKPVQAGDLASWREVGEKLESKASNVMFRTLI